MSSPSPPPVPPAAPIIADQTAANKATAITQYGLNAANQYTPQGSMTYNQTGTWPDGTPRYESTVKLSPEQEQLYQQYTANQQQLGKIGGEQLGRVSGLLNTPFDFNASINNQQSDIARKLLDPTWNMREGQLDTKLANQGITSGSEARTNALRDFGMQRDNAYLSALLGTRTQAASEALANRNQPLNEIGALLSGSQVSMPSWNQTPNVNVQPTDVAGINQQNFANQQQNYGIQAGQQNAMMGGLFGLAAAPLGGWAQGYARRGGSPF